MPDLMAQGGMANPQAMLSHLMGQMGDADPQMAMLRQMMQARTTSVSDAVEGLSEEDRRGLELRLEEAEQERATALDQARKFHAAYLAASERLADLAAALGACGLCWGEDDDCPGCRGRGHIGMVRPDTELRVRLLGPPRKSVTYVEQSNEY
jgi:hypothetical protein